jgi:pimeloyl-ACP methyl ester carboxylesterase
MIAFRNPLFDGQLRRTLGHATYGGAEIGECLAVAARVTNGDRRSWHREWVALADRTFAAAESSAGCGQRESARSAFLRASNYYRTAYVFHLEAPLPRAALEAYLRHREAFRCAAAAMPRPLDSLSIPFEDFVLPGYFCALDAARRPLVIAVGGYDSTAEESFFWNGAAALVHGYHCLLFDGPGQGAPLIERGIPFRPDWEKAISAVVDAAVKREDVDASRIVLVGESWGGYLAPRAAARDGRVAACVLDPAQIGLYRAMLARLPFPDRLKRRLPYGPRWLVALLRALLAHMAKRPTAGWALRRGMLTHGVPTPWDYFVEAARYDQEDLIGEIRCPTLVCDAENDDISAFSKAFFERLRCEKGYLRFTAEEGAGEHCASGNRALFHERVFDWLAARVAAGPPCEISSPASPSTSFIGRSQSV